MPSDQMLLARRKALDVGVLVVLEPPGLLPCDTPADTKALRTLPTGRRNACPAPVYLAVIAQQLACAHSVSPKWNQYEWRPKQ